MLTSFNSVHIVIKEQLSLELLREGGLKSMEVQGDMNLQLSDAAHAKVKLALSPLAEDFSPSEIQFKQHPHVAKFGATGDRIVALKDPQRSFPVGQSLAVLKWRYTGKDESHVPLSSEPYFVRYLNVAPDFAYQSTVGRHRLMTVTVK